MTDVWMCSCGDPWFEPRHKAQMVRDVGNKQWNSSPALVIPHRQWVREKCPGGHEGFVCVGDDGFIRGFDSTDKDDFGELAAVEWKGFGARLDRPTEKAFRAIELGRVREVLVIRLHGGNVPGPLTHYPVALRIADDNGRGQPDELPEQPVVAECITVTDFYTRHDDAVTEAELVGVLTSAVGLEPVRDADKGLGVRVRRWRRQRIESAAKRGEHDPEIHERTDLWPEHEGT